jgi:acetyl esterase/lipase
MNKTFHPELQTIARFLPRGVGKPWLVRLLRRLPMPSRKLPDGISVTERQLQGAVSVRVIGASPDGTKRPVILWIHGGGYIIGSAKQDDWVCARFAQRLNAIVVSVEYRLAPEHPFPAPLEDCFSAYEFILREAESLGVDPTKIIIAGQSAGGGLAAALALLLHDRGCAKPLLQLLVYPMLDDRTVLRPTNSKMFRLWDQASNKLGWSYYLGKEPGDPSVPDHAAPARREDFSGLPTAWLGVGTHDLFYEEDLLYVKKLREANVSVTLEVVEGAFHGFDAASPSAEVSERFFSSQIEAIERALQ